jgi:hypothetical protein
MRYATSELDKIYPVRHVMFVCDCGRASDQVIVPANPGHDGPDAPDQHSP